MAVHVCRIDWPYAEKLGPQKVRALRRLELSDFQYEILCEILREFFREPKEMLVIDFQFYLKHFVDICGLWWRGIIIAYPRLTQDRVYLRPTISMTEMEANRQESLEYLRRITPSAFYEGESAFESGLRSRGWIT